MALAFLHNGAGAMALGRFSSSVFFKDARILSISAASAQMLAPFHLRLSIQGNQIYRLLRLCCKPLSSNRIFVREEMGEGELSISLRPLELTDADDAVAWTTDPRVFHFISREPCTSRDETVAFIRDFAIPDPWFRGICVAGRPIGLIFIKIGEGTGSCRAEIGYALAHQYWGLGIATSAVSMMVNASFRELPGLERIEGQVDSENFASQRVLEKCGFVREGILRKYKVFKGRVRDTVMFSILSQDVMRV